MKTAPVRIVVGLSMLLAPLVVSTRAGGQDFMTPVKEHQAMNHEVGVWDAEVSMWEKPDAKPTKDKAVETNKMLGGMWLLSEFEGAFGGQKFSGRSSMGYDPVKKKYVVTWVDTMSPFATTSEGEYDDATHALTMLSQTTDPMTGKPSKMKMVTRYEGEDEKTFEIHMPVEGEDGKWWKTMEAKYKRRK